VQCLTKLPSLREIVALSITIKDFATTCALSRGEYFDPQAHFINFMDSIMEFHSLSS
jgi:hypothetical protein